MLDYLTSDSDFVFRRDDCPAVSFTTEAMHYSVESSLHQHLNTGPPRPGHVIVSDFGQAGHGLLLSDSSQCDEVTGCYKPVLVAKIEHAVLFSCDERHLSVTLRSNGTAFTFRFAGMPDFLGMVSVLAEAKTSLERLGDEFNLKMKILYRDQCVPLPNFGSASVPPGGRDGVRLDDEQQVNAARCATPTVGSPHMISQDNIVVDAAATSATSSRT
ncbi:hypothetical protein C8Q79DRAFT_1012116 [Trametes meyenii]|nr:hypothetical protein C8Q79DRAFT_1012116 [Trametes meyenii]